MRAFTETIVTKEEMVKELKKHQELDSFMKGTYNDSDEENNFKGCAVGCSLESISRIKEIKNLSYSDHSKYEKFMGIPEWLARVEDAIFEGVREERSKSWPVEFIEAVNIGANLNSIKPAFLVFVLESNLEILQDEKFKQQREAVETCIALWKRDDIGSEAFLTAARSAESTARYAAEFAAWSAARSAESAAWSAAWSAAEFAARSAARSTESAAWSAARYAARSAESAAWSAAESAESAWYAAEFAARSAAYEKFADKLLELMRGCL